MRQLFATTALTTMILLQSCGSSSFATQLRVVLAASAPLVESLNLGDKKAAVLTDFTDLAQGAATLSEDLKLCTDNPCKLAAVQRLETRFWDIERRGHFKLSPKLEKIQAILDGILASAKIYFGAKNPSTATVGAVTPSVSESDIKVQINALKAAMAVK